MIMTFKDACCLKNAISHTMSKAEIFSKIKDSAFQQSLTKDEKPFEIVDVVKSVKDFRDTFWEDLLTAKREKKNFHGVIKDYRNWMNIPFDFNSLHPNTFTIISMSRMNPKKFQGNQPWRAKEWYHLK